MNGKTVKVFLKKSNAKEWPSFYSVRFLEPGLVSYEDVGAGIAMLSREAITKMMPSFMGKPVIEKVHRDMTPENMDKHAVGHIVKVYWGADGWAWCDFILTSDSARKLIQNGYSVSCSYGVGATGKGGEWHAIKYDEEILDGVFNHLAIVDDPRYEACGVPREAAIYCNSKGAGKVRGEESDVEVGDHIVKDGKNGVIKKLENNKMTVEWDDKSCSEIEYEPKDNKKFTEADKDYFAFEHFHKHLKDLNAAEKKEFAEILKDYEDQARMNDQVKCPKCGSGDVKGRNDVTDYSTVKHKCLKCGEEWTRKRNAKDNSKYSNGQYVKIVPPRGYGQVVAQVKRVETDGVVVKILEGWLDEGAELKLHDSKILRACDKYGNSKTNKENVMFKLFRPKKDNAKEKEAIELNAAETLVEIDGEKVSLQTILNSRSGATIEDGETLAMDSEIEVDGQKTTLEALVTEFKANKKKNEKKDEDDKDNEKEDDDEKDNAKDEEDDKDNAKDEEEDEAKPKKPNAKTRDVKFFRKLNSQRDNAPAAGEKPNGVDTLHNRLARGAERYGSKKS